MQPAAPTNLDDPALYINRDLSWLEFNRRVLEEAQDPTVPMLERLKFLAIFSSNLDEFFMVRVGNTQQKVQARIPDGSGADQTVARGATGEDRQTVREMVAEQYRMPERGGAAGPPGTRHRDPHGRGPVRGRAATRSANCSAAKSSPSSRRWRPTRPTRSRTC